jgi:hypothetical protein
MPVKVQSKSPVRNPSEIETPPPDYPLRVSSFFLSVGTHCLGIAALMFVSFPGGQPERPLYEEFIRPREHKILFYDFRQKVPGLAVERRGAELSEQAIIATSPKPRSKHLFLSVPTPKIRDSPGYRLYRHPGLHGADISSSASHHWHEAVDFLWKNMFRLKMFSAW